MKKHYLILIGAMFALGIILSIEKYTQYLNKKCDDRVKILELELNEKEFEIEELKKINKLTTMELEKLERTNKNIIESNKIYIEVIKHFNEHKH
ncbi:MAG: hypothetical protein ACRDDY_03230 [Clostridium sp.]|uniref:hypothetical protein n=1 Tax=Clostridium sp. TaxID=1506 RepID=UPI003EE71145